MYDSNFCMVDEKGRKICYIALDRPDFMSMFIPTPGYTWFGVPAKKIIKIEGYQYHRSDKYPYRSDIPSTWTVLPSCDAHMGRSFIFYGEKLFTLFDLMFNDGFKKFKENHPKKYRKLVELRTKIILKPLECLE